MSIDSAEVVARFGRYEAIEELLSTGKVRWWRARDPNTRRPVTLAELVDIDPAEVFERSPKLAEAFVEWSRVKVKAVDILDFDLGGAGGGAFVVLRQHIANGLPVVEQAASEPGTVSLGAVAGISKDLQVVLAVAVAALFSAFVGLLLSWPNAGSDSPDENRLAPAVGAPESPDRIYSGDAPSIVAQSPTPWLTRTKDRTKTRTPTMGPSSSPVLPPVPSPNPNRASVQSSCLPSDPAQAAEQLAKEYCERRVVLYRDRGQSVTCAHREVQTRAQGKSVDVEFTRLEAMENGDVKAMPVGCRLECDGTCCSAVGTCRSKGRNRAPVISGAPTLNPPMVTEGKPLSVSISPPSDPDGDTVTCAWYVDGQALQLTGACGGRWGRAAFGEHQLKLEVVDSVGNRSTQTWRLSVRKPSDLPPVPTPKPNRAPVISGHPTLDPSIATDGKPISVSISLPSDPDGNAVTCDWSVDGQALLSTGACGGRWASAVAGAHRLQLEARDSRGNRSKKTWKLTVRGPAAPRPTVVERDCLPSDPQQAAQRVALDYCASRVDLYRNHGQSVTCIPQDVRARAGGIVVDVEFTSVVTLGNNEILLRGEGSGVQKSRPVGCQLECSGDCCSKVVNCRSK